MREFDEDLTDYIRQGISPDKQHVSGKPGLYDCKELIVSTDGLRARPGIHALDADYGSFADYPFPQLFNNISDILVSNADGVFVLDTDEEILTDPAIEVIDFNKFLVISTEARTWEVLITDVYTPMTDTNFTGDTPIANYNNAQGFIYDDGSINWSLIGKFVFSDDLNPEAGNIFPTFPGDVIKMLQLSNHMVCYGDEGSLVLSPVQQPPGAWRVRTVKLLAGIGIKSQFAVCDTGDRHLFIGNDDNLWSLDGELKLEKLGYENIFAEMDEPIMEFVAKVGCTYISTSDRCYIYTEQGLTRVEHYSRSLVPYYGEGTNKVAGYPSITGDYDQFEITTLPIDFKLRAVKHIQALELDVRTEGTVECAIEWRRDYRADFRSTPWVRLNDAGVVHLPCSGVDFKIKIRGDVDENFYLASLKAKIKYENKTTLRGKYAR